MISYNTSFVALAAIAALAPLLAQAQVQPLPVELSGRWTFAAAGRTNTFALDEIKPGPDKTFTARLTWWTSDPKCTIRNEPMTGRLTDGGILFDAKTKCDIEFTTELNRGEKGWLGKAVTKGSNSVTLELQAK